MANKPNILLVHGAWADASHWRHIIPPLHEKGYRVFAAQLPLTSLSDDIDRTSKLVAVQDAPTLLVGHAYGCAVITGAGVMPNVVGLVYLAGPALDEDESLRDLFARRAPPEGLASVREDEHGFLWVAPEQFHETFCHDLANKNKSLVWATNSRNMPAWDTCRRRYAAIPMAQAFTQYGTWYIHPETAQQLITDRRAGRPMPWHGKPLAENLRTTYRLWEQRKHPKACKTCAGIWGRPGAPTSFKAYAERYPPLAHGAKRHLTLPWTPGLSVAEVARKAGCEASRVRLAIANGTVNVLQHSGETNITKTDATRWISRGSPIGDEQRSWISIATATKRYLFTKRNLNTFIAQGKLKSKTGTDGAMRGVVYVSRQQCAALREIIGFTEREAARRAGLTVPEFRTALAGVNWRGTGAIPLVTVQAVIKRLQSRPGHTIEEAAKALGKDVAWVEARITDGTVRLLHRRWDTDRLYLSEPMMRRLRDAEANPRSTSMLPTDHLRLGEAAFEAGVTPTTIMNWADCGDLERLHTPTGWQYPRDAVRARARLYWQHIRFKRATPPQWLRSQLEA